MSQYGMKSPCKVFEVVSPLAANCGTATGWKRELQPGHDGHGRVPSLAEPHQRRIHPGSKMSTNPVYLG